MLIGKSIFLKVMEPEDWRAAWEVFARPDVWPEIVGDPALVIPSNFEVILLPPVPGCDARAFGIWTRQVQTETDIDPSRLIGFCALTHISWINRRCTAGPFGIAVEDGQPPYARDCFEVLLRHVFDELNLNRIEGHILSGNPVMERLYQWAGMKQEGRKREWMYQGGRYRDDLIYAMLRQDYLDRGKETP